MKKSLLAAFLVLTLLPFTNVQAADGNVTHSMAYKKLATMKIISSETPTDTALGLRKVDALVLAMRATQVFDEHGNYDIRSPDFQIPANEWYTPYVKAALKIGILSPKNNPVDALTAPVTKAEFVTMLYRAHTILSDKLPLTPIEYPNSTYFSDVTEQAWYKEAVHFVSDTFYFNTGTEWERSNRDSFDPMHTLTKQEALELIFDYESSFAMTPNNAFAPMGIISSANYNSNYNSDDYSDVEISYTMSGVRLPTSKALPVYKALSAQSFVIPKIFNETILPTKIEDTFLKNVGSINSLGLDRTTGGSSSLDIKNLYQNWNSVPLPKSQNVFAILKDFLNKEGIPMQYYGSPFAMTNPYGYSNDIYFPLMVDGLPLTNSNGSNIGINLYSNDGDDSWSGNMNFPAESLLKSAYTLEDNKTLQAFILKGGISPLSVSNVNPDTQTDDEGNMIKPATKNYHVTVALSKPKTVYLYYNTNGYSTTGSEGVSYYYNNGVLKEYYIPALQLDAKIQYDEKYMADACNIGYYCTETTKVIVPLVKLQ